MSMKKSIDIITRLSKISLFFALILNFAMLEAQQYPSGIKNIVLVHGAFVDGSGWKPVYDILVKKGYHVNIVQQPLTTFINDVDAVKRILALQDEPCILVGHSYGG